MGGAIVMPSGRGGPAPPSPAGVRGASGDPERSSAGLKSQGAVGRPGEQERPLEGPRGG